MPTSARLILGGLAVASLGLAIHGVVVAQSAGSKSRADVCVDTAAEMVKQNKFSEAADSYVCAADETAKLPGGVGRAARFRANAHLYRSWAIYTQRGVTGTMGRANLEDALSQVDRSLPLWREARFPVGEQLTEGWRLYLLGVKLGLDNRYAESRERFEKARAIFTEIGNSVPPLRDTTQWLASLAEDQTIFTSMMDLMSNRDEYGKKGGEVNQRLAELKERAQAAVRPYYDALERLFRAMRLFDEAGARLEAWDHAAATRILDEATKALATAQQGVGGVPSELRRAQFQATLDGWRKAVEAETHHARALDALLEHGDMGKAKAELIEGAESYRSANAAFEKATLGPSAVGAVQTSSARLKERAKVVAAAFGPTQAMLGVGKVFVAIFFVTLGVMTWLRSRLGLEGKLVIWVVLVVSVIGAFGLKAADIFNGLKSFRLP